LKEAGNMGDAVTAGIATDRIEINQKNSLMLKSGL
jgi:hypothetical protein